MVVSQNTQNGLQNRMLGMWNLKPIVEHFLIEPTQSFPQNPKFRSILTGTDCMPRKPQYSFVPTNVCSTYSFRFLYNLHL